MRSLIILLSIFLFASCSSDNNKESKRFDDPCTRKETDTKYWYYYKGITNPEEGGTVTTAKIYHIGDQTEAEGVVIEITSEGKPLKD